MNQMIDPLMNTGLFRALKSKEVASAIKEILQDYQPLELAKPKSGRVRYDKKYYSFYREVDGGVEILVTRIEPDRIDKCRFITDKEILDRIKEEVTQILFLPNSIKKNYVYVTLKSKTTEKITFGWFVFGYEPKNIPAEYEIDHINQDTSDNRRSNLRIITKSANRRNRKGWGKYGKGVRKTKNGKYEAILYLPRCDTPEEAQKIYAYWKQKVYPNEDMTL